MRREILRSIVFVGWFVRSATLAGRRWAGDQHCSGFAGAWRRFRPMSAFSIIIIIIIIIIIVIIIFAAIIIVTIAVGLH